MRNIIRQNMYYFFSFFLLVITGGIILATTSKEEITLWVNAHYSDLLDKIILIIDKIGTLWFSLFTLIMLWTLKGKKVLLNASICFTSVMLITMFTKYILFPGTLRPTLHFEDATVLRLLEGVIQLKTESFPSGHTSSAFAIFTFLSLILPKKHWHILFALIAASVGYARVYLSQHFITDVYTGMIIGVIVTTIIYWLFTNYTKKKCS